MPLNVGSGVGWCWERREPRGPSQVSVLKHWDLLNENMVFVTASEQMRNVSSSCSYVVLKNPYFLQYPDMCQAFHDTEVMPYCLPWKDVP